MFAIHLCQPTMRYITSPTSLVPLPIWARCHRDGNVNISVMRSDDVCHEEARTESVNLCTSYLNKLSGLCYCTPYRDLGYDFSKLCIL